MRILFMGHGKWACLTLEELVKKGHDIAGVVCELDSFDAKEREHYKRLSEKGAYEYMKDKATSMNLDVYQPEDINTVEFLNDVKKMDPELIVMVSYHAIVKEPLISAYKNKIINVHGAPLPNYRGRSPINWAIINGEDHTGVTVHYISKNIDEGDIIAQDIIPIKRSDNSADILQKTMESYPRLTLSAIDMIKNNTVVRTKQDEFSGCYFPARTPDDGLINWSQDSNDLYNLIRSQSEPYSGAFTHFRNKVDKDGTKDERKVYFWKISDPHNIHNTKDNTTNRISPEAGIVFGKTHENYLKVTTKDSYIILEKAQVEGGEKKVAGELFRLGTRFE